MITLENLSTQHVIFRFCRDGSTDSGVIEQDAIYVQYLENGFPQTKFAGIKPPIKRDAEVLLFAIENVLKSWRAPSSTPSEREFDEGINNIFQFHFYSPARRREMHKIAMVVKDEFKQLGRLKNNG